eukprot:2050602-Prorocentrum_lima.AAC.1
MFASLQRVVCDPPWVGGWVAGWVACRLARCGQWAGWLAGGLGGWRWWAGAELTVTRPREPPPQVGDPAVVVQGK